MGDAKRRRELQKHTVILRESGRMVGGAEAPTHEEAMRLAREIAAMRPESQRYDGHQIAEGTRTETGADVIMHCGKKYTFTLAELGAISRLPREEKIRLDCPRCKVA